MYVVKEVILILQDSTQLIVAQIIRLSAYARGEFTCPPNREIKPGLLNSDGMMLILHVGIKLLNVQ